MNRENQFQKKSDKKTENQCQNAASENKKPPARNVNLILTKKLALEWTMNGFGKPFRKMLFKKLKKNSKNQSEKTTSELANFCSNTVFSLYLKKLERKHFTSQNHSIFLAPFPVSFDVTKITTPDFKNHQKV